MAAASAGAAVAGVAVDVGRDEGNAFDAGKRGEDGDVAASGSGVMMLTAGVEAAVGKSALVGLPVGIDGEARAATDPVAAAGTFHNGK